MSALPKYRRWFARVFIFLVASFLVGECCRPQEAPVLPAFGLGIAANLFIVFFFKCLDWAVPDTDKE